MNITLHITFDPLRLIFMNAPDGHASLLRQIEHLLTHTEHRIMTKIKDYGDKQVGYNEELSSNLDAAMQSVASIAADVQGLNDKITALQNSPGVVTPEDQALLDQLETQGAALGVKFTEFTGALAALDDTTAPVQG